MKVTRYHKGDKTTYSLGATVTMEYLVNRPSIVRAVILHPDTSPEITDRIKELCKGTGIEITYDAKAFNILSQKENCFVIGVIDVEEDSIGEGSHVVLVNPSNSGNMGTIVRSCAGFGIDGIAIVLPAADIHDPKTIRASMGATSRVKVEVFNTFDEYRARFPENNLYPFMLDGSTLLQETEILSPFSLIMGNEGSGLPGEFKDIGQPVRIEHTDAIDSLNLPIATSIGLYEATKMHFIQK
ncbi:MAG: TrmH family RNA methyltransferase [Clostridiales bacterium]|nr:TrmH family RNA methyltransferase [Clostridiales bacterium]